jgi:Fe-S cluster assembly scaffold protein SufB
MSTEKENVLDETLEESFNDAMADLQKSLDDESVDQPLSKAKKSPDEAPEDEEGYQEGAEDEDEDEDEDEEKGKMNKSIEELLSEDPESAAAMDIEPFLVQFVKALDESLSGIRTKVGQVEKLAKSIGKATLASASLQKSMQDTIVRIGETPVSSQSVRALRKARFEGEENEVDTREVLSKSRDWVKKGSISLLEAGNLERRINKNLLGKVGDDLDNKVKALMKEGN